MLPGMAARRRRLSPARGRPPSAPAPSPPVSHRARRRALVAALAGLLLAVAVASWLWITLGPTGPSPRSAPPPEAVRPAATYVGAQACRSCHPGEFDQWQRSHHALAMQVASEHTVLGDFDDRRFSHGGISSVFFRRDGRFMVRTDGPDGRPADFEVKYTFGVTPLQQYLVELPGGRLQALLTAWDTRARQAGGQRWFFLYPDERIDFRDELHWTGAQQNWNHMCADCHSTRVRKNYDPATNRYATTWAEINVACEACHGPGSRHLAWAQAASRSAPRADRVDTGLVVDLSERRGVGWTIDPGSSNARRSTPRTTTREIGVCAQCHARRGQISQDYQPGDRFLDHYLPALLSAPLYYPDGQQRDEVYTWGSFLQSRMYHAGVTCSDCHEPHGQRLRAPGGQVCAQCHAA